jgi:hypothetical protein
MKPGPDRVERWLTIALVATTVLYGVASSLMIADILA